MNMTLQAPHSYDPALYPTGTQIESGGSAVSWPAIWAGTVTIVATTLILLFLGSGFGLSASSPWPGVGATPTTFTIGAGIWLIVTQWLSAALGGYMAGRLRVRWPGLHTDEVLFRDTAHGLLSWGLATIMVVATAVVVSALSNIATPPDVDLGTAVSAVSADALRRAAAAFAIFTAVSMLIGAFIACVAAAIGGGLRDKHP